MPTAVRDAEATRARLLAAATDEFARHGVAGARVDRIAAAAGANKQLIYAYFENKDGLFDAVLAKHCGALAEQVPFDAEDMPGYVGRLFDYALEHPEIYRLVSWAALERPAAVAAFERGSYGAKLEAIADAQKAGRVDSSFAPADLLALLMAVAAAWFSSSEAIRRFDSKDPMSPGRLAQFRRAAVESAARILSPPAPPATGRATPAPPRTP
ncbi:MAG TPA: TetR family transcriptional regulator [Thermoleophilaceae bacterium]|nr:TetR family transcriptional regulator [Thermoleophilaceae bacterium]